jgi:uncharacterized circularly permuted ATP-grasp superfamily protein/uncharacterized alpha-E superfamily protein
MANSPPPVGQAEAMSVPFVSTTVVSPSSVGPGPRSASLVDENRFREAHDGDGNIRPAWRAVMDAVPSSRADTATLAYRTERYLAAEGAGHMVTSDGIEIAWQADAIPMVIDHDEWQMIEAAMVQRARVMHAFIDDVLGDQQLIRTGVVPAAVLALPSLHLATIGRGGPITPLLMASDLVRDATGRWMVLRDLTDAPPGLAVALWNRAVSARTLPQAFAATSPMALDRWLIELRTTLASVAPASVESPRVVVMTGGPESAGFTEHSYLASALGYHLVEAGDLEVRAQRVWLRSLGHREPVDVIVRRIDDASADPLVSSLGVDPGVPGLLRAAADGHVTVINRLGTGIGASLAVQALMESLCRNVLGESLIIDQGPTWWGALDQQAAHINEQWDDLVLHDTAGQRASVFVHQLNDLDTAWWRSLLEQHPDRVVAQTLLSLATAPSLVGGELSQQSVTVRLHSLITAGAGSTPHVSVLPGGQARILDPDRPLVTHPSLAGKDVWVQGPSVLPVNGQRPRLPQVDLVDSLPLGAAEALWWLGRNAERAENSARAASAIMTRWVRHSWLGTSDGERWRSSARRVLASGGAQAITIDQPIDSLCVDVLPGVLNERIGHVVRSARRARSFLSGEAWRSMDTLLTALPGRAAELGSISDGVDRVMVALDGLAGVWSENTTRTSAWRLMDVGRRLERVVAVLSLVEATMGTDPDVRAAHGTVDPIVDLDITNGADDEHALCELTLACVDSLGVARRRYRSDLTVDVVEHLLRDEVANPRSFAFQLAVIGDHLDHLPSNEATIAALHQLMTTPMHPVAMMTTVLHGRGAALTLIETLQRCWFASALDVQQAQRS